MAYIFAYDGGGTKTRLNVVDLKGKIVLDMISTGSNIVSAGDQAFKDVIQGLFIKAKESLNIENRDISYVFLGLSGADLPSDYKRIEKACLDIFGNLKFKVLNDAWIILRSGLSQAYGACCICGTGTNACAINQQGKKTILRALSYITGTFGGGLDIARDALHYAFRSEEKTYIKTMLESDIPKLLGLDDMASVIPLLYPKRLIDKKTYGDITGVVEACALKGDQVSLMILEHVAKQIALQTTGVVKQLSMEKENVPIVVGGRVFQIKVPIFLQTFKKTVKEHIPNYQLVIPKFNPVIGAYFFALDELGIKQTIEIENQLLKSGGKL